MYEHAPKQTVDLVYTKHDLFTKLQELRKSPEVVHRNQIYILTKHVDEFHALTRDHQVTLVTTHGMRNFIKELLFKESPIEKVLRRMNLSHSERVEYEAVIRSGGMVVVSGTDPFNEEEWTGHTLTQWITNRSNSSNITLHDIKEERVVPYEPERKQFASTKPRWPRCKAGTRAGKSAWAQRAKRATRTRASFCPTPAKPACCSP